MSLRVGVDIGGTFTDFYVLDEDNGDSYSCKVPSRPDEPGAEIFAGLLELQERYKLSPAEIRYFTHGTTVGVNTVIQRNGPTLCLLVTEQFEDVLEVARLKMPDPYDLFSRRPEPLIPREHVIGLHERVLANGEIAIPLDLQQVRNVLDRVREIGAQGVVIALLHAYRNPAHERQVRDIIEREAPELSVTCSSDVWPIIREYERTVTAVVAGYAQPRMTHYLRSLEATLSKAGVPATAMITKSNGGVMTASLASKDCSQALLSGTAAGVIGAAHVAKMTHTTDTMSLDIGGTSADVAFIRDGRPEYGLGELIGEFPIYIPTVSVTSIGEGGGSIAWLDDLEMLKVGPASAGALPGPACYGRGGKQPTLTDAFVVSGFLGTSLGYATVTLDVDAARGAVGGLASTLSRSVEDTAEAIIRVATSGMYLEVSKLLSRYGLDPSELTLQAFGGAGPMLAGFVARELGMKRIIVPTTPGVLSAFGGLIADIKADFIRTVLLELSTTAIASANTVLQELSHEALNWLEAATGQRTGNLVVSADMRYRGQSFEIEVLLNRDWFKDGALEPILAAFHTEHARIYGHSDPNAGAQIVNLRVVAIAPVPKPVARPISCATAQPEPTRKTSIWVDGGWSSAASYDRKTLAAGHEIQGPAIVEQADCTTCLLPGSRLLVDPYGNLDISLG